MCCITYGTFFYFSTFQLIVLMVLKIIFYKWIKAMSYNIFWISNIIPTFAQISSKIKMCISSFTLFQYFWVFKPFINIHNYPNKWRYPLATESSVPNQWVLCKKSYNPWQINTEMNYNYSVISCIFMLL